MIKVGDLVRFRNTEDNYVFLVTEIEWGEYLGTHREFARILGPEPYSQRHQYPTFRFEVVNEGR
jgi:hypothetical protein|tara:strand:+ start:1259 stop:1450 length:192 start_codon:yes stop_codon:yes gene_type:complete